MATSQPIKILIIGASYAGLAAATNLLDLSEGKPQRFYPTEPAPAATFPIKITLVDERDGYYHVIGSPLALADSTFTERSWTKFEDVAGLQHPAIRFIQGSVTAVKTDSKNVTILPHDSTGNDVLEKPYDYLLVASGLRRVAPVVPASLTRNDYLTEAGKHIDKVKAAISKEGVVVVGGGAVGIEMAAELKVIYPELKVRLVHSRDKLLSSEPLPDGFKDKTLELLREVGIEVVTGKRVVHVTELGGPDETTTLTLSDGETLKTSFIINAISHATPTSIYLPKSVLTSEGHIKITPTLHFLPLPTKEQNPSSALLSNPDDTSPYDPYHLAAGDITHWPGIRRCGAAMHMGSYAAHNIHAHILSAIATTSSSSSTRSSTTDTPAYKSLTPHPPMIGLALGITGIAHSPTEGTSSGPEVLKMMFQDDLGFSICWNYMKLGEKLERAVSAGGDDQERDYARGETSVEVSGDLSSLSSSSSVSEKSSSEPRTPLERGERDMEDLRQGIDGLMTKTKVSPIRVEEA